jgi:thiamine-monophosphate kinase
MRGEFDFIKNLRERYELSAVGDDCAVVPQSSGLDLVVTTDLLVEDVDFRLNWTSPELLGHKALAVSLSDVAAMGGKPRWSLTSIGVPETLWNSDFIDRFYKGWHALAEGFGVVLIGGDVSRSPDKFVVDSVVGGQVPKGKSILRSGARPGDAIFVTGGLGGAAGGLQLLENGIRYADASGWQQRLIERQLVPLPRVAEGGMLLEKGIVNSMIDLSDGLSSDLHHICEASAVGAEIEADAIPIDEDLKQFTSSGEGQLDFALHGGEDFELLFTVPEEKISELDPRLYTRIGIVTANVGMVGLTRGSERVILGSAGFQHF